MSDEAEGNELQGANEVLDRIQANDGTRQGQMLVKGTLILKKKNDESGEWSVKRSNGFEGTLAAALASKEGGLPQIAQLCSHIVRERDVTDELEFFRFDYKYNEEKRRKKGVVRNDSLPLPGPEQLMVAVEHGDFIAAVLQEYKIRDLRTRVASDAKDTVDPKQAYKHVQKDLFFPSSNKTSS